MRYNHEWGKTITAVITKCHTYILEGENTMKKSEGLAKRFYIKEVVIWVQIYLLVVFGPLCGPAAIANPDPAPGTLPSGYTVPYGEVGSFDTSIAGELHIRDVADGTVINWQNFDIGAGATTQFHQVSSSAWVLNRVSALDGMTTGIMGNLIANGGIIVLNPRGIVFGPDAIINAGKFVASGLRMSNTDFLDYVNGTISEMKFTSYYIDNGTVTNNGAINAGEAIYLVGKNVTNTSTGTLSCPGGAVVIAAGEGVKIVEPGSNVVVNTGMFPGMYTVTNAGTIDADGGSVILAAGDVFSQAAIEDAASFVAQADRDITISAPVSAGSFEARADRNINIDGALNIQGDITLYADADHTLPGDFHSTAPITAGGNIDVKGNDILFEESVYAGGSLTIKGRDCHETPEWPWGNVTAMKTLDAEGDITISVTGEKQEKILVCGGKCWGWHWEYHTVYEPGTIRLNDDVTAGGNLTLYNDTYTAAGVTLKAGNNIILAEDGVEDSALENCSRLTGSEWLALRAGNEIQASKTVISVTASTLIMEQGLSLNLDNFTFDNQANTNLSLISNQGSVTAVNTGTKPENAADQWESIGATAYEDITLSGSTSIRSGESGTDATKSLWAINGDIYVEAGDDFSASKDIEAGGNIEIYTSDSTIYLWGDTTAGGDILLDAPTEFEGLGNQRVDAGGTLTANGYLRKVNEESDGSLYLHAGGDISLADDVTAAICYTEECWSAGGGVSIISDNGRIYTPGFYVEIDDLEKAALAIDITGRSDHFEGTGVDLPYGPGKAAIVIQNAEDLVLHGWSDLTACGRYYEPEPIDGYWSVDDRVGVGFLAEPAIIGGYPRNEGEPFDAAIYVGSKAGDVHAGGEVDIRSAEWVSYEPESDGDFYEIEQVLIDGEGRWECVRRGTMIADAYDTVTFGTKFEDALANGRVGDRLEVCSRITEWLDDAIAFNRLPYADNADAISMLWYGDVVSYISRGAGAENHYIGEGAPAWVLESEGEAEFFGEAAPIQEPVIKRAGCPALVNWLANELGLGEEQVEVLFAGARGLGYDIQPCDTCARLQEAARILLDSEGTHIEALARVVNEIAAAGTPPSEEQMALIAAALENPEEGTDYALANDWLDALTDYVTMLHSELGLSTEDATAAADKYVSPIVTGENVALAGYITAVLSSI
jgi:filamentous hemagglutinin family protein